MKSYSISFLMDTCYSLNVIFNGLIFEDGSNDLIFRDVFNGLVKIHLMYNLYGHTIWVPIVFKCFHIQTIFQCLNNMVLSIYFLLSDFFVWNFLGSILKNSFEFIFCLWIFLGFILRWKHYKISQRFFMVFFYG